MEFMCVILNEKFLRLIWVSNLKDKTNKDKEKLVIKERGN